MCGFWIHFSLKKHNTCILASTYKLAIFGSLHLRERLLFLGNVYFLDALHMQVSIMVLADSFTFRVNMPVAAHTSVTCALNSLMSLLFDARREVVSV